MGGAIIFERFYFIKSLNNYKRIQNMTFEENTAQYGGVIVLNEVYNVGSFVKFESNIVNNNNAEFQGGFLYIKNNNNYDNEIVSGIFMVKDNLFEENFASSGQIFKIVGNYS